MGSSPRYTPSCWEVQRGEQYSLLLPNLHRHAACLLPPPSWSCRHRASSGFPTEAVSLADHLADHLVSFPHRLSWQAQMLSPGPYIHHPAAPSCCSRQGAPVTAARLSPSPVMLPSGAKPFVPQDSCLTTEPQRRSYTPALGLPPLHRGAGGPQGSCPGLVQP